MGRPTYGQLRKALRAEPYGLLVTASPDAPDVMVISTRSEDSASEARTQDGAPSDEVKDEVLAYLCVSLGLDQAELEKAIGTFGAAGSSRVPLIAAFRSTEFANSGDS